MAVASYGTDLVTIDDCTSSATFDESTDTNWEDLGPESDETDWWIVDDSGGGTPQCISAQTTKTGIGTLIADYGSDFGGATGECFFAWQGCQTLPAIDTLANGGQRMIIGSSLGDFYSWDTGGSDFPSPYGNWVCNVVDPDVSPDDTVGTPTATERYFGVAQKNIAATSRGYPFAVDHMRFGRGKLYTYDGDTGAATFSGMASANDATTTNWGLFQSIPGGYLWKGLIAIGDNAGTPTACTFTDSNVAIVVQDTKKVTSGFNKIEISHASSVVSWTNVNITALGTVSKGAFECVADATVTLDTCVFTDMDTFIFDSNSTVTDTTFRRCGQVTVGAGTFSGCLFDESTAASAVSAATPAEAALISNSDFVSDGTGHGITIGGTAANITLTNVTFTGYAASDGSTGDEAIYVNIASGSMNITVSGAAPSIRTAGASVTVVTSARTVTVKTQTTSGTAITTANVFLRTKTGGTGPFPENDTVTISNSGTTATVTHTAHGMATNDYVLISGASLDANNGVFQITLDGVDPNNKYSYTMGSSPGSSPTGTIKCWFVFLKGTTDGSGEISMSRSIPSDQDVEGWSAKASGSPYYQNGVISGIVSSSGDTDFTAVMALDE